MNPNSGTSLTASSSHVTHHNDLTGGGAANRINSKYNFPILYLLTFY